jgi:hypothetical protein
MSEDRAAKLREQRARIDARLRSIAIQERQKNRRADARKKIIAGALALEHAQMDSEFAATLARLLNRYVTRPQDRALFGLPERVEQEPANDFQAAAGNGTVGA